MRAKALNTDDLSLRIARSGSADLAGRAARLDINLSGSGGIDAADLRADDVRVSIAGSGDVSYSGEPTVQRAIAGSGRVRKR